MRQCKSVMTNKEMNRWRLEGRRALVTGGTKGIGEAVAQELMALGASVTIIARDEDLLRARVGGWREAGLPAYGIAANVTRHSDRVKAIGFAVEQMGGLDILVNNVGTNRRGKTDELSTVDIKTVMRTNLTAPWELCRLAHPYLKNAGQDGDACIVGIGSVAGSVYVGSGAPYGMTKAAMDQLTRYLAVEWAEEGIRVNSVNPWYTNTPLAGPVLNAPERSGRIIGRTPNRRIAEPDDISGLVAFLCLPAARHITGQIISVDGGFLVNGSF